MLKKYRDFCKCRKMLKMRIKTGFFFKFLQMSQSVQNVQSLRMATKKEPAKENA